jgi:hypothetical protein
MTSLLLLLALGPMVMLGERFSAQTNLSGLWLFPLHNPVKILSRPGNGAIPAKLLILEQK